MKAMVIALIGAAGIAAVEKAVPLVRLGSAHEASAASHARTQDGDRWTWRGAVAQGKTLEIRGISGSIRAEPSSGGAVEVSGLAARVDASTVNGDVTLETTAGEATGTTVNGGVRATVSGAGQGRLSFSTVNGSIDVSLASGLSADFSAETVNGGIQSDFPVTVTGRISPRRMRGQIGQGGRQLDLRTVNGSVHLHGLP